MTACGSVCVRVKCSLTLSTCLSNELALQQNVRQDRNSEVSSAKRLAVLVQDASMRGVCRDSDSDSDSDSDLFI